MINLNQKIYILISLFVLISTSNAQTVDEILEKHFEVIGQDKLSEIQTTITNMVISQHNNEIPYNVYIKRPNKIRTELKFQGLTQIRIVNGKKGWKIDPFMGEYDAVKLNQDEIDLLKDEADLDREWFNYQDKGYKMEYLGKENTEGQETFVLKVIKQSGYDKTIYIDTKTYLICKIISKQKINDVVTDVTVFFNDHKRINGILYPHLLRYSYLNQKAIVEKIEFDKELSDDLFEKP